MTAMKFTVIDENKRRVTEHEDLGIILATVAQDPKTIGDMVRIYERITEGNFLFPRQRFDEKELLIKDVESIKRCLGLGEDASLEKVLEEARKPAHKDYSSDQNIGTSLGNYDQVFVADLRNKTLTFKERAPPKLQRRKNGEIVYKKFGLLSEMRRGTLYFSNVLSEGEVMLDAISEHNTWQDKHKKLKSKCPKGAKVGDLTFIEYDKGSKKVICTYRIMRNIEVRYRIPKTWTIVDGKTGERY
jgi:hypothetical protein